MPTFRGPSVISKRAPTCRMFSDVGWIDERGMDFTRVAGGRLLTIQQGQRPIRVQITKANGRSVPRAHVRGASAFLRREESNSGRNMEHHTSRIWQQGIRQWLHISNRIQLPQQTWINCNGCLAISDKTEES